jgi:tetratricopeptide (TPR) repeat protein
MVSVVWGWPLYQNGIVNFLGGDGDRSKLGALGCNQDLYNSTAKIMAAKGEHLGWMKKGQGFLEWKQYKQALQAFEKAIKAKPNYAPAWVEKGRVLGEMDETEAAIQAFDKAIKLAPADPEIWILKSLVLENSEQGDAAVECLHQATLAFDEEPAVMLCYGACLTRQGQGETAIAAFDKCLELSGGDPMTLLTRSAALTELGRYEEALGDLDRIALYGEDPILHQARGDVFELMGRYEEALDAYTTCVAEDPSKTGVWLAKGMLLEKLDRMDEALQWYNLSIFSIAEEGWLMRGQLLQRLKQYDEALEAFDQALTMVPNYASAHYDRAVCLIQKSDEAAAAKALQQAIDLSPETFRQLAQEDPVFAAYRDRPPFQTLIAAPAD